MSLRSRLNFERGKKIKIGLPVRLSDVCRWWERGAEPAAVARGEKERCSRRRRRRAADAISVPVFFEGFNESDDLSLTGHGRGRDGHDGQDDSQSSSVLRLLVHGKTAHHSKIMIMNITTAAMTKDNM